MSEPGPLSDLGDVLRLCAQWLEEKNGKKASEIRTQILTRLHWLPRQVSDIRQRLAALLDATERGQAQMLDLLGELLCRLEAPGPTPQLLVTTPEHCEGSEAQYVFFRLIDDPRKRSSGGARIVGALFDFCLSLTNPGDARTAVETVLLMVEAGGQVWCLRTPCTGSHSCLSHDIDDIPTLRPGEAIIVEPGGHAEKRIRMACDAIIPNAVREVTASIICTDIYGDSVSTPCTFTRAGEPG